MQTRALKSKQACDEDNLLSRNCHTTWFHLICVYLGAISCGLFTGVFMGFGEIPEAIYFDIFHRKWKWERGPFKFFFYSFLLKCSSTKYTLWASHHLACENTVFIYSCHDEWILQFVPLCISHIISCWCASANTSPKMRLNAPFLSLSAPLVPQHGQFPLC